MGNTENLNSRPNPVRWHPAGFFIFTGLVIFYGVDFLPNAGHRFINELVTSAGNYTLKEAFKNGFAFGFVVAGCVTFLVSLFRKPPKMNS